MIVVGMRKRDEFGERTPCGEAGLEMVIADLRVAGDTLGADAATDGKRDGDTVARMQAP